MSCNRKIGPFDCCSVVCGDCLELMKQLPDGCVDAVITDPPYGIGESGSRSSRGRAGDSRWRNPYDKDYGVNDWDTVSIPSDALFTFKRIARVNAIFGGNYYPLPPTRCWLIWDKESDGKNGADCEMAWTNLTTSTKRIRHLWDGFRQFELEERFHPTQKPLRVMTWCIHQLGDDIDSILDPYCGSGTTLVAAKKLGRHFLGFEISPEYCEIARDRLARIDAQPNLFAPKPEQMQLGGGE